MPSGYPFSPEFRTEFFRRVGAGEPLARVARSMGVSERVGQRWWAQAGGMKLRTGMPSHALDAFLSADGSRATSRFLGLNERTIIEVGRRLNRSYRDIGELIGRDKSVVCREIQRNTSPDGIYRAGVAHHKARLGSLRPKKRRLVDNPRLCRFVENHMDEGWSPKLISLVLAKDYAHDVNMQVSHETIYQCLYVQAKGQLRQDLYRQLSLKRRARKPRERQRPRTSIYSEALVISQRPAEVADRAVPGHWEGDLIMGPGNKSAIGTLVERSSRFTLLLHLPSAHTADAVALAMVSAISELPSHLRRSITWDRGTELALYRDIQFELQLPVYFADPHSPWQRGTNENTNRLLRHWFAKGTDLSEHSPADLRRIQDLLNQRPRPTLDLATPAQKLNQLLQTAA